MPTVEALLAFALASLILIAIPGPSVLFVIGRSLSLGRRGGLWSVLGNELGGLVPITAVALGVGSLVAESVALFTAVKLLGAAYLAWLGVQAIRRRRDGVGEATNDAPRTVSSATVLRQGFIVGATNPKTIVFFVAALPQFVDFHAGAVPLQMMVLGLVFTVIAFACDGLWALGAGSARAWFERSPRRLAAVRGTGGGMMIGLGGTLLFADNKA
ncbi:threonine/homoserine/homoserine lactone efflux protein [Nocardioides thalensis]|uniref:Threonine/homoserine/homoserine lactone efflux protein n=1 Tax=Nocardioides thalensis TaxID=1914755 RepID=A0A853C9L6_9ACTN|nr:LysE family translocator [Nocardioides thalensis]NYJ03342.1 threonine/homoserine/homoserine lactone efflux protein [Nocardioides thalensis]